MRQVVLRVVDRDIAIAEFCEVLAQQTPHKQLLLDPNRHRREKTQEATGRKGMVRLQQTLELQERFVIERYGGKILVIEARFSQDITTRVDRERRIVFLSGESFLLRRSDNLSIDEDRRCAIVVVS